MSRVALQVAGVARLHRFVSITYGAKLDVVIIHHVGDVHAYGSVRSLEDVPRQPDLWTSLIPIYFRPLSDGRICRAGLPVKNFFHFEIELV